MACAISVTQLAQLSQKEITSAATIDKKDTKDPKGRGKGQDTKEDD